MPTVYVETTIPSYYLETRRTPSILEWRRQTRRWWETYRQRYELVTSRFVVEELAETPGSKGRAALRMLDGVRVLEEPARLAEVVARYMQEHVMPAGEGGDAYHLAMASLHGIDFLLTWNCRHLANANKIRHISVVNERLGLPTPVLTTPLALIPEDDR